MAITEKRLWQEPRPNLTVIDNEGSPPEPFPQSTSFGRRFGFALIRELRSQGVLPSDCSDTIKATKTDFAMVAVPQQLEAAYRAGEIIGDTLAGHPPSLMRIGVILALILLPGGKITAQQGAARLLNLEVRYS